MAIYISRKNKMACNADYSAVNVLADFILISSFLSTCLILIDLLISGVMRKHFAL